jgi:hypothetical protein
MKDPILRIRRREDYEQDGIVWVYDDCEMIISVTTENYSFSCPIYGEREFWDALGIGSMRVMASMCGDE